MRNLTTAIVAAVAGIASPAAAADFCTDLRAVLAAAPSEFASFIGEQSAGGPPHLAIFLGTRTMEGADVCAVAQQGREGRRYSTSYTCSTLGRDSDSSVRELVERVNGCLGLTTWTVQRQEDNRGPWLSQYGLIRLSITRNGERGLALGVEVLRDQNGAVMGSPMRGDVIDANGVHRCSPKAPEEIARLIAMYGERPGAERFEDQQFLGYTNRQSQPVVAFTTRPNHPAHPAIIVRSVQERDGSVFVSAGGDFAGDCEAFHDLLRQVQEMNQNLRGE